MVFLKAVLDPMSSHLESWTEDWFANTKRCIRRTSAVTVAYAIRPLAISVDRQPPWQSKIKWVYVDLLNADDVTFE